MWNLQVDPKSESQTTDEDDDKKLRQIQQSREKIDDAPLPQE